MSRPLPKVEVGTHFFEVYADEKTGKCEMQTWQVRTIRGGRVTAIMVDRFTWVKLSTKHGDWGWAKYIDPLWRRTWDKDGKPPDALQPTRKLAWRKLLGDCVLVPNRLYIDDREILLKIINTAKRFL